MADQHIRGKADQLPENEKHHEIIRENDAEHREHEERERREIAGLALVFPHVSERINMDLLRLSNTNPRGTLKTPLISIHNDAGAEILDCMKIKQPQTKLPRTAATEMKLLSALNRSVNKVMAIAEPSGKSNTHHGSMLFTSI